MMVWMKAAACRGGLPKGEDSPVRLSNQQVVGGGWLEQGVFWCGSRLGGNGTKEGKRRINCKCSKAMNNKEKKSAGERL